MARGRKRSSGSSRAGSVLVGGGGGTRRRRGGPSFGGSGSGSRSGSGRRIPWRWLLALLVLGGLVAGGLYWRAQVQAREDRRAAAQRFAAAWERRDHAAMWRALTPAARTATPQAEFVADYKRAEGAAGVDSVRVSAVPEEADGQAQVVVAMTTRDFGPLRGAVALPLAGSGDTAGVDWRAELRLPGLRRGEAVRRRAGDQPRRANILAADGTRLNATQLGASLSGVAQPAPTGLERVHDRRLAGHPSASLRFGSRVIARTQAVRGRSVRTTLRPGLSAAANAALGGKLGGVAVLRPRDGAVLALAGLALSAPQPPGSTFKIITVSAALEYGVAKPSTSFAPATFATLSGVKLGNAGGERCGGTLVASFVESCNSVFAPLGAKVGARRLVAMARAFGFGETPAIPSANVSSIASAEELRDDLAVGSAAIGQERDLATPLQMASVGATIATGGRRARPRVTTIDPVVLRRAISGATARQVRAMMLEVVRSGTGTAAAISGVEVAGKTGTAELRPNSKDPKDADAWFVAFAPARDPQVAVAVMLVGAGFGGTSAAPIAKRVMQAALARG